MSKETEVKFEVLKSENVNKEIKVLLLLEMLHNGEIGFTKAKELCTETGIFSEHWVVVDANATEIFSSIHSKERVEELPNG